MLMRWLLRDEFGSYKEGDGAGDWAQSPKANDLLNRAYVVELL